MCRKALVTRRRWNLLAFEARIRGDERAEHRWEMLGIWSGQTGETLPVPTPINVSLEDWRCEQFLQYGDRYSKRTSMFSSDFAQRLVNRTRCSHWVGAVVHG